MKHISALDASLMALATMHESLFRREPKRLKELLNSCEDSYTRAVIRCLYGDSMNCTPEVLKCVAGLRKWWKACCTIHNPKWRPGRWK